MSEENSTEFQDQVTKDISIDEYHLVDENRNLPNIVQKYIDMQMEEQRKYNKIKLKRDSIYRELFIYYTKEHEIRFNTSDAKKLVEGDDRMLKVTELLNKTDENIEYLKSIRWLLRDKKDCIKNIIDLKRSELG